ncbi:class I SAM-dependent DNA methyltransferase [Amycolatopsis sp. cmx-11-12]|uniref:class I SAM-dependent DNA methyltransferase n=1 Tax=Amycolatopsis sp. cmx-11-12 TaxID=2785795 RepID=UPI003916EFA5
MHLNGDDLPALVSRNRRSYDECAAEYARSTDKLERFPGLDLELDRFLAALPAGAVLDLGCGAGRDAEYLIERGADVLAGDISAEMLRYTRRRCVLFGAVQCDLLALPLVSGVFAGVWACASVLHLPRRAHPVAFSEIHRVLAPGGAAAISLKAGEGEGWVRDTRISSPRWFSLRSPDAVVDELSAAGFVSVRVLPSGRATWFVVEAVKAQASHSSGSVPGRTWRMPPRGSGTSPS